MIELLIIYFLKNVFMIKKTIATADITPDVVNLTISKVDSVVISSVTIHPKIFCMIVLQVRNMVTITTITRKQFDHSFCGACFMNCGSFKQINRQIEKKGSKQALNT